MAVKSNKIDPADFTAWSDRAEAWIVKAIKTLLVLLVLSQVALQFPEIRQWLASADHSEGVPYRNSPP